MLSRLKSKECVSVVGIKIPIEMAFYLPFFYGLPVNYVIKYFFWKYMNINIAYK